MGIFAPALTKLQFDAERVNKSETQLGIV